MMRTAVRRLVLAMAMLGLTNAPARAALIFFTDRASYNAATTGNTQIGFEGIAPDNNFVFEPTPPGITLSGVNFTVDHSTNRGSLFVIGQDYYYTGNSVLSSSLANAGTDNIVATLPGGFTAFAVDFGNFKGTPVEFTLSTGETFTEPTPVYPGLAFAGFVSSTPFTMVRLDQAFGDVLNIDNVTFGQASTAVPEPGTLALGAIAALAGLVGWGYGRARA